jgi:hypothetical protein
MRHAGLAGHIQKNQSVFAAKSRRKVSLGGAKRLGERFDPPKDYRTQDGR